MIFPNPYLYFKEGGRYYILFRFFPYYVAEITAAIDGSEVFVAPITGYNLWVRMRGTLDEKGVLFRTGWKKEVEDIMIDAAQYFLEKHIQPNPKRYKKFAQ